MNKSIIITELECSLFGIIKEIKRRIIVENIYKLEQLDEVENGSTMIYLKNGDSFIAYEDRSMIHKLICS